MNAAPHSHVPRIKTAPLSHVPSINTAIKQETLHHKNPTISSHFEAKQVRMSHHLMSYVTSSYEAKQVRKALQGGGEG